MASNKSKKSGANRIRNGRRAKPLTKRKKTVRKVVSGKQAPPNLNDPREKALALMKKGVSQAAAARVAGISTQRLARYRRATTSSKIKGRKWVIKDRRPSEMFIASDGKIFTIAVPFRGKSAIGRYWNAVNEFLIENDRKLLSPFAGRIIRDVNGKKLVLETEPNNLRMMDAIGELNFINIYRHIQSADGGHDR